MENLIYAQVEPIIDSQLPHDQTGFRQCRSTIDRVTLFTREIYLIA